MKKLRLVNLTLLLLAFAGFTGCNTEDVDFEQAQLDVTKYDFDFGMGYEDATFEVKSNRDWKIDITSDTEISEFNPWIKVDPAKGSGSKTITISVLPNEGAYREAVIKVYTSTLYKYVNITQQGTEAPPELVLYEDMGSREVSGNTNVDEYQEWSREGSGAESVTYTGTNTTVRTSTKSGNYPGASSGNNIFFGYNNPEFNVNDIDITGKTNFTLTFGLSHQVYPVFAPVTSSTINVWASIDGQQYAQLTFTNPDDANWVLVTSEFKVPEGSTKLYLKFNNPIEDSNIRLDDVKLMTGGNGALIDVDGPGPGPGPGEEIYYESVGSKEVSDNPEVNDFEGWLKQGTGASTVTYSAINSQVRKTAASSGYQGASGGNNVFLRAAGHQFNINGIDITGATNFTFTFGLGRQVYAEGGSYYVPVGPETVKLWASLNGTDYAEVAFTCNTTTEGWVLATSEFKVPAGSTRLYMRFDSGITASEIRLDDFRLTEGGNGAVINPGGGTDPTPTEALYIEDCGKAQFSGNQQIAAYTGWSREGALSQSAVTYTTNETQGATVRTSSNAAYAPVGNEASGFNFVYMGYADQIFQINNINITGNTSLTFQFNASFQNGYDEENRKPLFGVPTSNSFKVEWSADGNSWTPLNFTVTPSASSWTKIAAPFTVTSGTNSVNIRISEVEVISGTSTYQYRLDDFSILSNATRSL